ncbi:MAG: MFS transporter [Bryobacterales bacterium]|nr:MFS transporter [Bryobacterales bacterium]
MSWRAAWLLIAGVLLVVVLPGLLLLLKQHGELARARAYRLRPTPSTPGPSGRDWRLNCVLPAVLALPFVQTGLFLYQLPLAASKGWSAALIASAFTGYAVSRALSSIFIGPVIDRWSAARLLPVYLVPNAAGLLLLLFGSGVWIAPAYLVLVGVSAGCSSSIVSSVWAEFYGPEHVGTVRSAITSLVVLSTAGAPLAIGFLLEGGVGFPEMLVAGTAIMLVSSLVAVPATPWAALLSEIATRRLLRARG